MSTLKVNKRQVMQMFNDLQDMGGDVMTDAGKYFKDITPINKGNAQSKTNTRKETITAGYGYAARLDDGWSKQAPKGMTEPTMKEMDRLVTEYIKRVT